MAEKNIRLKDGDNILYPLTKIGNVDGLQTALDSKLNHTEIAPDFSTSAIYAVDDYVIYEGVTYRCIEAITTAGAWNSAKWVASKIGEELNRKANWNGTYPTLNVGKADSADQLSSSIQVEDKEPYNFRTAGGSADIGNRMTDKIVGGTIAWNQLISIRSASEYPREGITATQTNGKIILSGETTTQYTNVFAPHKPIVGHKYLFISKIIDNPNSLSAYISFFNAGGVGVQLGINGIITPTVSNGAGFGLSNYGGAGIDLTGLSFYANCIDLTQMFGSTIADYIYSLEQANAGDGVAWFKRYFPKDYYAYNAGGLESVKAGSHNTNGFNQWDEEYNFKGINQDTGAEASYTDRITSKNFIPALPNTVYYFKGDASALFYVFCYDANYIYLGKAVDVGSHGYVKNETFTTLANTVYIKFAASGSAYGTIYKNDICINLHWDGERDGEYEPYVKHIYELDNSLELRGIPKLDANNDLYYDGDEYESDGTVTRRYGVVDLGTLSYYVSTSGLFSSSSISSLVKHYIGNTSIPNAICPKYAMITYGEISGPSSTTPSPDMVMSISGAGVVAINNLSYNDIDTFKTAMSGVYLVYELATPTTESADPYANPQVVDDFGTEEYVDYAYAAGARDMAIPVGHDSFYMNNLRAKLEMAPNSPDGDGYYLVHQESGTNIYTSVNDIALTEEQYQEIYNVLNGINA